MEMIAKAHIERIKAAASHKVLWGGGPPDNPTEFALANDFVVAMGKSGSIQAAQAVSGIDDHTLELYLCRSPWFCERINFAVNKMLAEMKISAISRAIGFTKTDSETGKPEEDATGRIKRYNASDALAQTFLRPGSVGGVDLTEEAAQQDFPDPLLPSNIDLHRQQQLNSLHRAMLALQPQVDAGDRQAIDTLIKLQDQVAKLSGTHAPKQSVTYLNTDGTANLSKLSDAELDSVARQGLTLVQGADGTYRADGE